MTKSKIFYQKNIKRERRMCFCNADLGKYESCGRVKEWLLLRYRAEELPGMARKYAGILERTPCPERYVLQIDKDVARTYPDKPVFQD